MKRLGVALRTVEDDEFVTNETLIGFASKQASKYTDDLAANVRHGLAARAAKGIPHAAPRLGYRRVKDEEGETIGWDPTPRRGRCASASSPRSSSAAKNACSIARLLNREGIPRSAASAGPRRSSAAFSRAAVLGEFEHVQHAEDCRPNPGRPRCECPRVWLKGTHAPLIDEATWQAAQVPAERSAAYGQGGKSGRVPKAHLLYGGMLRCGLCEAAMMPRSNTRPGREWARLPDGLRDRRHRRLRDAGPRPRRRRGAAAGPSSSRACSM